MVITYFLGLFVGYVGQAGSHQRQKRQRPRASEILYVCERRGKGMAIVEWGSEGMGAPVDA